MNLFLFSLVLVTILPGGDHGSQTREMGRTAQGVRSIKLGDDDFVVDMVVLKEGKDILTVSQNGFGKRSEIEDYRLQSRAGKGIKAGIFNEKTGRLVNLKQVSMEDDVMLITDTGIIIRMRSEEISKIGRDTQGIRLMKMKNEGSVVCVAIARREEEFENSEDEQVRESTVGEVEQPTE